MMMIQTETETLFEGAPQALVFAFHRSNGTASRPLMNRLASGAGGGGDMRGLGGLDGVAQAAMLLQGLERNLSELHFALLRARYGVRERPCQCCGHLGRHPEWMGALHTIAVRGREKADRPSVSLDLAKDLVLRYFEKSKIPLEDIGSRCGVGRTTAYRANTDITRWLRGDKGAGEQGVESLALRAATDILFKSGVLRENA